MFWLQEAILIYTISPCKLFSVKTVIPLPYDWKFNSLANALKINHAILWLIPYPVASEHRWLVIAPRWIHSVPDVSGRRSWRRSCHVRLWNLHNKTSSVEAQIGLLRHSFCSFIYPGVGLIRKTPRGWIQISESHTWGVARIPLGLKPSRDSCATSQWDSPIWIQPLSVFHYKGKTGLHLGWVNIRKVF